MPRQQLLAWMILGALLFCLLDGISRAEEQHPRLFVAPERLATIRRQIRIDGSHHQMAYEAMRARVENGDIDTAYFGHAAGYKGGYCATEAALLSLIVEDEAQQQKYADIAFDAMLKRPWRGSETLGKSMFARCLALTYDWAYPAWSEEQRQKARKEVDAALKHLAGLGHTNLGGMRTSNFIGVIRGAEMLLLLSSGGTPEDERYRVLKKELRRYVGTAFGNLGVSHEGLGYSEYPGGFFLPAVYAAKELGDPELYEAVREKNFWKLAMYAYTCMPVTHRGVQYGVSSGSGLKQGFQSLVLNLCPEDQLPYYLWFYDRSAGRLAPLDMADARFDGHRAGTVWTMLYYPADVTAKDPTGAFPKAAGDDRGFYFFRNRWRDENDIQASIMADTFHPDRGWDQPEQLAINLLGYHTRFIGGPRKNREQRFYSALLVNGKYNIKGAESQTGTSVAFEPGPAGGYAIVDGGALYESLDVDKAQRHMLVAFSEPDKNEAIITTLDDIKSSAKHTYTWQANIGSADEQKWMADLKPPVPVIPADDNVKVTAGTEAGRPMFLLEGRKNGFVKGWVLEPADARITAGDPLTIETDGTEAKIWVVMFVGSGKPPAAQINGSGMQTVVKIGDRTTSFDGARIVVK